ncbi:DNA-directed RNA polymerase specialized sigma subunit [Desulfohalotomaculum tongense]|uniref:helix-turn-helix domain-containing protein n=1 Tax=Desulforadius tongensis TaxID=1216062 RepID=UPI00195E4D82|nr:DNA-directed RNA polymerase specialized sigma subunit [Desulforadius tongensis]
MEEYIRSRVPWTTEPSLVTKTEEVGVDFDRFIDGLKNDRTDAEIAQEFGVSEKTIAHLRNHFMRYGIGSTMGQD